VLARMEPDDAADLLLEIDQERRLPVLNLMPTVKQLKIRKLLGFNPSTAGGLMNLDFISVGPEATVDQAIQRFRASDLGTQQVSPVCVAETDGKLAGALSMAELHRPVPTQKLD